MYTQTHSLMESRTALYIWSHGKSLYVQKTNHSFNNVPFVCIDTKILSFWNANDMHGVWNCSWQIWCTLSFMVTVDLSHSIVQSTFLNSASNQVHTLGLLCAHIIPTFTSTQTAGMTGLSLPSWSIDWSRRRLVEQFWPTTVWCTTQSVPCLSVE